MAYSDLIAALRLPAHPLARTGYGKRGVPAQPGARQQDFNHLPMREGCIAAYIDRLPEGSAIDTKTLAKSLPMYGQQAVRSALRNLSEIGHLRRIKERISEGRPQWVQRTYFSSIARSDSWWTAYLAGEDWPLQPPSPQPAAEPEELDAPEPVASVEPVELVQIMELVEEVPEPPVELEPSTEAVAAPEEEAPAEPVVTRPAAAPVQASSDAYQALAALGGVEPRLTLSARECEAMESLAAEWFARGSTPAQFLSAMTAGLPGAVHSRGALVRTRLMMKLPPEVPVSKSWLPHPDPFPPAPVGTRIMECTDCGRPGRPEALPGGLCNKCRNDGSLQRSSGRPAADELRRRVEGLRGALRSGTGCGAAYGPAPA